MVGEENIKQRGGMQLVSITTELLAVFKFKSHFSARSYKKSRKFKSIQEFHFPECELALMLIHIRFPWRLEFSRVTCTTDQL